MSTGPVVVAGAGPAGLTAARYLAERGTDVVVCERDARVGGISRTEVHHGYRFDIGGHRFLTRVPEIQQLWETTLGSEFIRVPRQSRIFYRDRYFDYPVNLWNVITNLGPWESALIAASYFKAHVRPDARDDTFERWVTNRFGSRLYRTFFKTYTEKVWGMPCSEIGSDWAAQRIKGLTFRTAVSAALGAGSGVATLAREFHYPRLGPGQMWERFADLVSAAGGQVRLGTAVTKIRHRDRVVEAVDIDNGQRETMPAAHVISSMPIGQLIRQLDPLPPAAVLEAAARLRHRDFILVGLVLDRPVGFTDNWLYVHGPEVQVGRIQNFGNWSRAMLPDDGHASLGMEYFCSVGDAVWSLGDGELLELAAKELGELRLASGARPVDGCVIRQAGAYPIYDADYRTTLQAVREYLAGFPNLQTIGRNGLHRYNNQDHSMLSGQLAARNILGERHDVWQVNVEQTYLEQTGA